MALGMQGGVYFDDRLPKDLSVYDLPLGRRLLFAIPDGYTVSVCEGDTVLRDAVLASHPDGSVLVSGVCGTVGAISEYTIEITALSEDGEEKPLFEDFAALDADTIVETVRSHGIFTEIGVPFWRVLAKMKGCGELLVLNAAENEPGVYARRAALEAMPERIAGGLKIIMKALALGKAVIATTEGQQAYAENVQKCFRKKSMVQIVTVADKYPVSHPKVLYRTLTGSEREPSLRNAAIVSVTDCIAVYDLFACGHTPRRRVVTVAEKNCNVYIGTPLADLAAYCGIIPSEGTVCHVGGYISAREARKDEGVTMSTAAVQYLHVALFAKHGCIECGKCTDCCPVGLQPVRALTATQTAREQMAKACVGCGLCGAVCPVGISPERLIVQRREGHEN